MSEARDFERRSKAWDECFPATHGPGKRPTSLHSAALFSAPNTRAESVARGDCHTPTAQVPGVAAIKHIRRSQDGVSV